MTDEPTAYDPDRTSQAEGDDPGRPDHVIALQPDGKPSEAEGEDPDDTAEKHEVLNPVDPE